VIAEGSTVSYVGFEVDGMAVGDHGRVLSEGGSGSHVIWNTGDRKGEITLVPDTDLVQVQGARISYNDSLDGGLITIAVRETYDSGGAVALLNALNDEGHLATFAQIAEEAMRLVTARIREDSSIREVLAFLDDDEGSDLVGLATTALLRDAFSTAEGE
jgi:hypothetical protein